MKTLLRIAAVVFILLLALPFMLQLRVIEVEDGKTEVLCQPLDGRRRAGGSAGADLVEELQAVYGDEANPKRTKGIWQEKDVIIEEWSEYTLEHMGRELLGTGEYLECTIATWRNIKDAVSGEELASGVRLSSVFGYDDGDLNSRERAHIRWGTLRDAEFHGSAFDAVPAA